MGSRYGASEALGGPEGCETVVAEVRQLGDAPQRGRSPFPSGDRPFVVQLEFDDGNGMWISNV